MNDVPGSDPAAKSDLETQTLEIMRVCEPLLNEGETWVVGRASDGTMNVAPASDSDDRRSTLQQTHPELYGALLVANERLNDSFGCGLMAVAVLSVLLPCLAIHGQVLHDFFPDPEAQRILEGLRSWWTYTIAAFVGLAFWIKVNEWIEAIGYVSERRAVEEYIAASGLNRLQVLAAIEGDGSVAIVSKRLKLQRTDDHRL